jgi:Lrp/AsnC family transcriptional regulator, leucine-responsive regulatory protein
MDAIDKKILKILQKNARTPNSDIAKKLKMAASSIWERIKKLEDKNIITQYSVVLNHKALNQNVLAFVIIALNSANWSEEFEAEMLKIKHIEELHEIIGEDSYIAKIRARDIDQLSDILKNKVGKIKVVKSTKTTISVSEVKYESNVG